MASAWGGSWGVSWGSSWGATQAAAVPSNPHAGGAGGGYSRRRGAGSPGGGGDNEWFKRLREEIERVQDQINPDADDIAAIGREIASANASREVPAAIIDTAREIAVAKLASEAANTADLLEKLALIDQWLAEMAVLDEIARFEAEQTAIEIEAEEFLLLSA